ncbi:MAG TPA: DUF1367 family protein, partial [Pyrodictium sp.]|nr:DUF1367 family protein [Pyrodictium sp.]
MELMLVSVDGGFAPYTKESLLYYSKMPKGDVIYANITHPRNNSFHRKYFKMLRVVSLNTDVSESIIL